MIISPKSDINSTMSHNQKPIAPKSTGFGRNSAVSTTEVVSSSTSNRPICRRRIAFHPTLGYPIPPTIPPKVARRNARERNRVKQVNCGFEMLRIHIPSAAKSKKMSKVDTLRHAVEYIQTLQKMVDEQHMHQHQQHADHLHQNTSLPPPLHLNNPPAALTPTPSSRASSIPSPMTPHMPSHHPHHHFVLPDIPTYPSPLTPRTPNTPVSTEYMVNPPYPSSGNDSGYDTSSFFSSASSMSPSLMSPASTCHRSVHLHQVELMSPGGPLRGVTHLDQGSPISPPVYHRPQQQYHEMAATPQFYNYNNIAESPEEEELLDAIANWQDQDHD